MKNEVTQTSYGRLDILYRISQTFNSSLDLDQVLELVMDEVIGVVKAERGFLMLLDENNQLVSQTARGLDQKTIEEKDFSISRGIAEQVAHNGDPLLTSNAQLDPRFDQHTSVHLYGLLSILCVPITLKGKILGVIYVDNRFQKGIFTIEDMDLLGTIASSAAIAIENARLYKVAVEKGRMERELQMARDVQVRLIPPNLPEIPGWSLASCWIPAHEVSGDFYDFIQVSPHQLLMIIADVSDKGMPAAMFMALSRSILRSVAGQGKSIAEEVTTANRLICKDAAEDMFITFFYALLDTQTGMMSYVNAGHNPPIFYQAAEDRITILTRTGMAAGVNIDAPYTQGELTFQAGDFIVMYTDGVTDTPVSGQPLGQERLKESIYQQRADSPPKMLDWLKQEYCTFPDSISPVDDLTMLIIRRGQTQEG